VLLKATHDDRDTAASMLLYLMESYKRRTALASVVIIRSDGGSGEDKHIDWLLNRDCSVSVKVKNWHRTDANPRWFVVYIGPKLGN
jgi:hypothetical protein